MIDDDRVTEPTKKIHGDVNGDSEVVDTKKTVSKKKMDYKTQDDDEKDEITEFENEDDDDGVIVLALKKKNNIDEKEKGERNVKNNTTKTNSSTGNPYSDDDDEITEFKDFTVGSSTRYKPKLYLSPVGRHGLHISSSSSTSSSLISSDNVLQQLQEIKKNYAHLQQQVFIPFFFFSFTMM